MRIFITVFFVFSLFINVFSQQKVLFDATKAETANNADWIIDADSWNLGYDPTPYIGGNEANAQRIPTPAQSGISSGTSESYWKGAISAWAVDLVKLGFTVETLPYNGQITYGNSGNPQDLSNYKIFVVCEPNILFTASEKTAMMNFVNNGGGLFMISDHDNSDRNGDGYDSPYIWNDFITSNSVQINPFGIIFDIEYFTEATENIPNLPGDPLLHGAMGDVSLVEFYGGTSITINSSVNSSVKGVVYKQGVSNTGNSDVMCAYATYGNGRVVALGDSSPADDGTGDPNDNLFDGWIEDAGGNHRKLILNATLWLALEETSFVEQHKAEQNAELYVSDNKIKVKVTSETPGNNYSLELFDLMGRKIQSESYLTTNTLNEINIDNKGIIIYQIILAGKKIKSGKIVM